MIKLSRDITPSFLTPAKTKELTDLYLLTEKSVWDNKDLKEALLLLSDYKCAYCECKLTEESKYMEVEHFENKKHNPQKVIEWDNLLPSCKRCNVAKGQHDVLTHPIINPFLDNPQKHLQLKLYRFKGKTILGTETIGVVDLNHQERAVLTRFKIGEGIQNLINELVEKLSLYQKHSITQRKNKLLGLLECLLKECQQDAAYTATSATVLHSSEEYYTVIDELKKLSLWNFEFEYLHNNSVQFILS
jgi:uncharacterized protein (TIGR02646 family)